ncbi:MAG TPA: plastocyanin/azurin family copper-binding protein [Candidatus Limnocylindrales bacterium]|nr:plastocyanin/azurin family copper-binding protein [Candidatus Limnocylindrales bacterium]
MTVSPAPTPMVSPSPRSTPALSAVVTPTPAPPTALPTTVVPTPRGTPATAAPAAAREESVAVVQFSYQPSDLTVQLGTTVVWTNEDASRHTVTSGPSDEPDGRFDSGPLEQGESFEHTFTEVGVYEYYCDLHPRMTARIVVQP